MRRRKGKNSTRREDIEPQQFVQSYLSHSSASQLQDPAWTMRRFPFSLLLGRVDWWCSYLPPAEMILCVKLLLQTCCQRVSSIVLPTNSKACLWRLLKNLDLRCPSHSSASVLSAGLGFGVRLILVVV